MTADKVLRLVLSPCLSLQFQLAAGCLMADLHHYLSALGKIPESGYLELKSCFGMRHFLGFVSTKSSTKPDSEQALNRSVVIASLVLSSRVVDRLQVSPCPPPSLPGSRNICSECTNYNQEGEGVY